jgi:HEPN/Toprim N-terminal domain 1
MSSYAGIYVNDKEVFSYRNEVAPEMLYLFSEDELLHLTGNDATKHAPDWIIEDMSPEEIENLEVYTYAASAGVLKDRLSVLGFGETLVKGVFVKALEDDIEHATTSVQMYSGKDLIKLAEGRLKALQKLDYDTWMQQLDAYISSNRSLKESEVRSLHDEGPLEILSSYDHRVLLRAILEHIDENVVVKLDLTELVAGGWLDKQDFDSALRKGWKLDIGVPIIITEGTYDAQVLKGAIEILKPHLVPYIRFLDYDFRNEGGASVAVSTLKSFAAAGINNRIVAIFDNDSAAREAVTALKGIKLPPQYKVIHYPDINLANEYPTLGPQGNVAMNVNGLAGSIELYLGADVLKDDEGNLMPVQWKGYMSKIKSYQGELLNKSLAQKAFNEKLKAAKTNRKNVDKQDWSGLSAILDKLVETLSNL